MAAITGFENQMPPPGNPGNVYTCTDTGAVFTDTGTQWTLTTAGGKTGPAGPTYTPPAIVLYSAAGTPLPAASTGLKGTRAVVIDATTPTYLGTYVSGGAVVASVLCTGAAWVTA